MSIRIPKADNPDICVHHFTMDGDCPHCERAEKTRDYEREIESLKKENAELRAQLDEAVRVLDLVKKHSMGYNVDGSYNDLSNLQKCAEEWMLCMDAIEKAVKKIIGGRP